MQHKFFSVFEDLEDTRRIIAELEEDVQRRFVATLTHQEITELRLEMKAIQKLGKLFIKWFNDKAEQEQEALWVAEQEKERLRNV